MKKATIQLEPLSCPSCLQKIEKAVKSIEGVEKESVQVMFNSSKAKVNFNEEVVSIEKIETTIKTLGYVVEKSVVKTL